MSASGSTQTSETVHEEGKIAPSTTSATNCTVQASVPQRVQAVLGQHTKAILRLGPIAERSIESAERLTGGLQNVNFKITCVDGRQFVVRVPSTDAELVLCLSLFAGSVRRLSQN
jgi:hypothetical protein